MEICSSAGVLHCVAVIFTKDYRERLSAVIFDPDAVISLIMDIIQYTIKVKYARPFNIKARRFGLSKLTRLSPLRGNASVLLHKRSGRVLVTRFASFCKPDMDVDDCDGTSKFSPDMALDASIGRCGLWNHAGGQVAPMATPTACLKVLRRPL